METTLIKIPTLDELVAESDVKDNNLTVLLNQNPPQKWLVKHPMATKTTEVDGNKVKTPLDYLPIERVEYLLTAIFGKWWVEVRSTSCIANSVVVTIRLFVINPVTKKEEWQDGIGAVAIQTDAGKGAMDWNYAKADGVMKAAPAAESYAIKDAAEKFGKLFGKDLNRKEGIAYDSLLKSEPMSLETLTELWEIKKENVPSDQFVDCERVILQKETKSYNKLFKKLQAC